MFGDRLRYRLSLWISTTCIAFTILSLGGYFITHDYAMLRELGGTFGFLAIHTTVIVFVTPYLSSTYRRQEEIGIAKRKEVAAPFMEWQAKSAA